MSHPPQAPQSAQPDYPPQTGYPPRGAQYAQGGYPAAQPPVGYPGAQPPVGYPQAQPPVGYPQAQPPVGYPQAQPSGPAAPQLSCRFCGCVPAANAKFRAHRGMLIIMQFRSMKGPFCRNCGVGVFRKMTADTLWQGWWGWASFIITPITVLLNLARRGKVAALAEPRPPQFGPSRTPMDPGPPVLARPASIIGLVIAVGIAFVLVSAWLRP